MSNTEVDKELYPEMDYLMNADESDVQFLIDGQTVPSVKLLLCMSSKVFRAMFSGNWRESGEDKGETDSKIEIKDTTPEAFKVMIGFIYSERLFLNDDKDMDHIRDVLKLADRYQLKRLMTSVGQHLLSMISMDRIERIGRLAFDYQLVELIAGLKSFIDHNFQQLRQKPQPELNAINSAVNNLLFEKLFENFPAMFLVPTYDNDGHYYRYKINGQIYSRHDLGYGNIREIN
ncbi:uncharacterized protein LOC128952454 [Oppia nitens]|uniref:uncharacterized protein LOC128952454 n=1 Tax=Oppia nitens TaxID=1686743 RepID=UPI0023DC3727|nr:uncharacterized protein LOC128952454 [Oppia nitens]